MQLSSFLSALALSAAAVSARRSLRHVGPVGERLEAHMAARAEPQIETEFVPATKRASSASDYQFLTNKTQREYWGTCLDPIYCPADERR